MMHGPMNIKKN